MEQQDGFHRMMLGATSSASSSRGRGDLPSSRDPDRSDSSFQLRESPNGRGVMGTRPEKSAAPEEFANFPYRIRQTPTYGGRAVEQR